MDVNDEKFRSLLLHLKKNDPKRLAEALCQLSDEEAEEILYSDLWLRPEQRFDKFNESIILFSGGRGAGKSFSGSFWVKNMVMNHGVGRIALVAPTQADCRDIMVEGSSGILSVHKKIDRPQYLPSKAQVIWPNGAIANMYSSEVPDSIRGGNNEVAWGDELSSWKTDDAFDQLMLTLRVGRSQALFTTTPKPTKLIKGLYGRAGKDVKLITASTYSNLHNLSKAFQEQIMAAYAHSRLGKQELDGLLLTDVDGALWNNDDIVNCTLDDHLIPKGFKRIVVAIDPSGGGADECGICVAGLGFDDIVYILVDATEKLHPSAWSKKAIDLYDSYQADCIVYEKNYGGAMVETTLESVRKNLPLKDVTAKKNKIIRAEPVATLYHRGRVKHRRGLSKLEDEMTTYSGNGKSPNRLDAMVYAVLELTGGQKNTVKSTQFYL